MFNVIDPPLHMGRDDFFYEKGLRSVVSPSCLWGINGKVGWLLVEDFLLRRGATSFMGMFRAVPPLFMLAGA